MRKNLQGLPFPHTTEQNKGKHSFFTGWVCCTKHCTMRDPAPANVEQRPYSGDLTSCAEDTQIFLTQRNLTETQRGEERRPAGSAGSMTHLADPPTPNLCFSTSTALVFALLSSAAAPATTLSSLRPRQGSERGKALKTASN